MTVVIAEFTSFDQVNGVAELNDVREEYSDIAWTGNGASMGSGWNGSGQSVVGPSNLGWRDNSAFYGNNKSGGVRFRYKLSTLGVTNDLMALRCNVGDVTLRATSSNVLQVSSAFYTDTSATTVDTSWHRCEFWLGVDAANGAYRVLIDGVEITDITVTNANTSGDGTWVNGIITTNANLEIDEVVIMFDSGIFDPAESLDGPARQAKIARCLPIAQGALSQWNLSAPNAGEQEWEDIDELIHDRHTSKIIASSDGDRSSYLKTQLDVDALEIVRVLAIRTQAAQYNDPIAGGGRFQPFIRANGVNYDGSNASFGFEWTHSAHIWTAEVETSVGFADMEPDEAVDAINAYEIGVYQVAISSSATRVSQFGLEVLYITGSVRSSGIVLRGGFDSAGGISNGYVCRLDYGPLGDIDAIVARYITGGPLVDIATAAVTTGYGLAFDQNYTLLAAVENVGGTNPANGQPAITVKIDGATVSGWTSLLAGIDIGPDDEVIDETADAILQGSSQGLYLIPPESGAGFLYYSLWNDDFEPDPGDEPPADEPTIPVGFECDGKTGIFAAPVGSQISVEVGSRVAAHGFETQHVQRILQDQQQRRRWRVELPAGMTTTEKTDLWTFWNAHGKSIPFDFADPETGDLVCAHFFDDSLSTVKAAPISNSYECVIEELLETGGTVNVSPGPAILTIETFAPYLNFSTPATAQITITTFAPTVLTQDPRVPSHLESAAPLPPQIHMIFDQ